MSEPIPDHPKAVSKILERHFGVHGSSALVVRVTTHGAPAVVYISQSDTIPDKRVVKAAQDTRASFTLRKENLEAARHNDKLYMQLVMDARARAVINLSKRILQAGFNGVICLATYEPVPDENGHYHCFASGKPVACDNLVGQARGSSRAPSGTTSGLFHPEAGQFYH